MYQSDTIAAISTPHGTGGIGIIRISGDKAFEIAAGIYKGKTPFFELPSHTVNYGKIIDPRNGEPVDEVLLLKLAKPGTFTREDTVEINCHGGIVVVRRVLELVLKAGARLAEPGEFTKRAFLNGRIDLSQAEAVIDIINAKTEESSKAAVGQLEGRLSEKLKAARKRLIELMAHMEVTFDYPEHDIEKATSDMVLEQVEEICHQLAMLSESFERGRIIREGITIVITGKPNVGKSSLLNELSGSARAIVTDIPGTTRDIIEEYVSIRGIPARIVDTAGIRETKDIVEKLGVEKAEKAVKSADLVIIVLDAGTGIEEQDIVLLQTLRNVKRLVLINKTDLISEKDLYNLIGQLKNENVLTATLKEGKGIEELEETIYEMFFAGEVKANDEVLLTNVRHKHLVDKAIEDLKNTCGALRSGMPLDLAAIDLKSAAENIGNITGESVSEDILNEIFSRFCIGK